ncbi:MAG TPA: polyphenol oxidase family protein [Acidimicrobiales bacterium]|nr:polyphenol oxidase family protein [Acidimicrobiales bacterium]
MTERRAAVTALPWTWLTQVHGTGVVIVRAPGGSSGEEADAAVTTVRAAALSVATADCAPVVLANRTGDALGVVHAGWRGLVDGVVAAAVAALRAGGADEPIAALGPCIHPACYEFGEADLAMVVDRLGDSARGVTAQGGPALDLPGAVRAVLSSVGVELAVDVGVCTACNDDYYSHRARGDLERQATVAWLP